MKEGSQLSSLGSLVWMLVSVVAVLALAYLFTKYVIGRGKLGGPAGPGCGKKDAVRILSRTVVGRESQLLLIEAGGRYLLLGATGAQIACLAEFTAEEAETFKGDPEGQPPSVLEAMKKNLKEVKRR